MEQSRFNKLYVIYRKIVDTENILNTVFKNKVTIISGRWY